MAFGIKNMTSINISDIERVGNSSTMPEFMIKASHYIFGGWFFFISMWLLFYVIFIALQERDNQLMINLMYASAMVSVISLLSRMVWVLVEGVKIALLSDFQMWIFPIITVILVGINWLSKKD